MLTEAEYLDPKRFPLTTQVPPVSFEGQFMVDAMNFDGWTKWLEEGGVPTPEEQKKVAELKAKLDEAPAAGKPSAPRPPVEKPKASTPQKMQLFLGRPKSDSPEDVRAFAKDAAAKIKAAVGSSRRPAPPG